jgi:hypothetical protein
MDAEGNPYMRGHLYATSFTSAPNLYNYYKDETTGISVIVMVPLPFGSSSLELIARRSREAMLTFYLSRAAHGFFNSAMRLKPKTRIVI